MHSLKLRSLATALTADEILFSTLIMTLPVWAWRFLITGRLQMRFAEFSFLLPFRLLTFSCRKKEIVYEKEVFVTIINFFWVGVIFLLALLTSCPGSPDIIQNSGGGGGGSSAPTEEDLTGQWDFYYQSLDSSDNFNYTYLIDIQRTLPEYWIAVLPNDNPVSGVPVKPNHTETEGGWFVVDSPFVSGEGMKYKFVDDDPNTLEGEILFDGKTVGKCRLERIPSEKEIELHIVTFKLDSSDNGYVFSNEDIQDVSSPLSIAVRHGDFLGDECFPSLYKDGIDVTAQFKFTTADGEFSKYTTVNSDDIIVTVTPLPTQE